MWMWIRHVLGLDDPSGSWYLWWSGVGADLGMIGAGWGLWRKHNCEIHRCWRLARHDAAGHRVCRRHHPEGAPTAQSVRERWTREG